ncbi:uncharacterized protein cubi_01576 [Cryptosporidium ubiquitum]|uniref:Uncharacterized protein n=1 Tax=Cryptosporidium ubiquitum TaxID=857276 RepID=A0A1J4MFK2_9CRYT|nr:uncharacterized protein cubi_01576 [Cryptosporidium ubiquitum]OII72243.1 hypothetical protein cubi_01576 [Cryptosporidium ubiquitum]
MNIKLFSLFFISLNFLYSINGEDIDSKSINLPDMSFGNMGEIDMNDGADIDKVIGESNIDSMSLGGYNTDHTSIGGSNIDGMSVGGSNIDGMSAGGSNIDGASILGSNAGETSFGGSNIDDNSIGGSNSGDTSVGGSNLGLDSHRSVDFEDSDNEKMLDFHILGDEEHAEDPILMARSSSNPSLNENHNEDPISIDSRSVSHDQGDNHNDSNMDSTSVNADRANDNDRIVTYGFGGGPVAPPASTSTTPPITDSTDKTDPVDVTDPVDKTDPIDKTDPTDNTSSSTTLTTISPDITTKGSVDPGVIAGAVVGGIAGIGLLGGLGFGLNKRRRRSGGIGEGVSNFDSNNLRGTAGTYKSNVSSEGSNSVSVVGNTDSRQQKPRGPEVIASGFGNVGEQPLPAYSVGGSEEYNNEFSFFED